MMGVMETDNVYIKYPVLNDDWELCGSDIEDGNIRELWGISLGNEMMSTCMGALGVSDDVKSEVIKFDKIYNFYMRDGVIRKNAFISYPIVDFVTGDIKDITWKAYNIDPWNRQFPLFFNNIDSDYYNNSSNKIRYGYWIFYKDCVISSSSNRTNGVSSVVHLPTPNNRAPLMILSTTSLDGVTVACLDMVEG